MQQREVQDKILAWCLLQPLDEVKARFKELANHETFQQAMREKKLDADLLYKFVLERLEFTHDEKHKLTADEIFTQFNSWYLGVSQGEMKLFKNSATFSRDLKPLLRRSELYDNPLPVEWLPKATKNGKVYCGLKFKELSKGEQEVRDF